MKPTIYVIEGINPEPWQSPKIGIGRKNGKPYPLVSKPERVRAFQEAVAENLRDAFPDLEPLIVPIDLTFYLWRQHEPGRNRVDATNCQKALEDALQGVLIANDRQVKSIHTHLIQNEHIETPVILIQISDPEPFPVLAGMATVSACKTHGPDYPEVPGNVARMTLEEAL